MNIRRGTPPNLRHNSSLTLHPPAVPLKEKVGIQNLFWRKRLSKERAEKGMRAAACNCCFLIFLEISWLRLFSVLKPFTNPIKNVKGISNDLNTNKY